MPYTPDPSFLGLADLPLAKLEPHPDHFPRGLDEPAEHERLCRSIDRFGILHPLIVYPIGQGRYRILDGYRRYQCAQELEFTRTYCQIVSAMDDGEYAYRRFMIHETVLPWTQAERKAFGKRMGLSPTQAAIAGREPTAMDLYLPDRA